MLLLLPAILFQQAVPEAFRAPDRPVGPGCEARIDAFDHRPVFRPVMADLAAAGQRAQIAGRQFDPEASAAWPVAELGIELERERIEIGEHRPFFPLLVQQAVHNRPDRTLAAVFGQGRHAPDAAHRDRLAFKGDVILDAGHNGGQRIAGKCPPDAPRGSPSAGSGSGRSGAALVSASSLR